MSKSNDILRKMTEEAKQSYTWELNQATMNFQWNIWRLREKHGWTQHELARRMGVSQPWVARHMAGYTPSLDSLAKYAHALGVPVAELVGEPMHFPPYPMWNDTGEIIGSYIPSSDSPTITRNADWKLS